MAKGSNLARVLQFISLDEILKMHLLKQMVQILTFFLNRDRNQILESFLTMLISQGVHTT